MIINLLPLKLREERSFGRKNRLLIGYVLTLAITALLVAVVMLGSLMLFGTDEASLRAEIAENDATIAGLRSSTRELNDTVTRLETVNQLYESGIEFSELVPQIGSILPEGTVLNGLSLTGGSFDAISLDVDMERPELAAVLVKNLVESDLFEAADIGNINPKGGDGDRYRYGTTISANFEGAAEAKAKAAAAAKAKAAAAAEAAAGGTE